MKPNSFFHHAFHQATKSYAEVTATQKHLHNFSSGEVRQLTKSHFVSYPDSICQQLKSTIARRLGVDQGMITVGNGSDEIIENIPRVFLEPGEPCLFVVPTFFRFIEACQKMKARFITIATREKDGFLITPKTLKNITAAIHRHEPKIIWLDSPNSVSGAVIPFAVIRTVLSVTHGLVVIDEVHHELIDPKDDQSAISLLPQHRNLIVLRSVSKAFGLAGIRFGFALAHPHITTALERWRLLFTVNTFTQKVALAALTDLTHLEKVALSIQQLRQKVLSSINEIPGFTIGAPSQTHLFLLKHQRLDLFEALRQHGILAADLRHAPGLEGKGYVRLNIKTLKESKLLLKTLQDIYNETRKQ